MFTDEKFKKIFYLYICLLPDYRNIKKKGTLKI